MTSSYRILVVDDEPAIRLLVRRALTRTGWKTAEAASAAAALLDARRNRFDLVILDLGLPDRDGLELIAPLRATGAAVLVLTAREAVAEKVAALDLGADDYVTKPFDTEELLARVRTALRHRQAALREVQSVRADDIDIDLDSRRITKGGLEVHLTPKEYALLTLLVRHADRVVTHSLLLRSVWGSAHEADVEYLRVTVRALRLKLERDPAHPSLIRNEPGVGYRLTTTP